MTLIPKTQKLQRILVHFFRINPSFLLGEALIELTRFYFETSLLEAAGVSDASNTAVNGTSSSGQIASAVQMLTNITGNLNVTSGLNLTAAAQSQGKAPTKTSRNLQYTANCLDFISFPFPCAWN